MAPSLVLSGYGELMAGSGASAAVLAAGHDFGAPAVETATVSRLLLDGDVVTGRRAGNRTLVLPVIIRSSLASTLASLVQAVDQPAYTLTFTPDGGLPVVFECFRGSLTREWSFTEDAQTVTTVTLTIPATPFTRTPTAVTLSPTVTSTQIDAFDSTTGLTVTMGAGSAGSPATSTSRIEGTASVVTALTSALGTGNVEYITATFARSISSTDLSADTSVGVQTLLSGSYAGVVTTTSWQLTLSSAGGSSTWQTNVFLPDVSWKMLTVDISGTPVGTTGSGVNLAAVTGWSLQWSMIARVSSALTLSLYLDDMRGFPAASGTFTGYSALLRFDGVQGSNRTPLSLQASHSAGVSTGMLAARCANPPPGFDPILRVPTSFGGSAADTTAVSGIAYNGTCTWVKKAYTFRRSQQPSTYVLLARVQMSAATLTATAVLNATTTTTQTITRTLTASDPDLPPSGKWGVVAIGEFTLPPRDIDPLNTSVNVTFSISGHSSLDQAWLVDLSGEAMLVQLPTATSTSASNWYLDAPTSIEFTGHVTFSEGGTTRAAGTSAGPWLSGQPIINLDPGSNALLLVVFPFSGTTTTPTVTGSYFPRYFAERPI